MLALGHCTSGPKSDMDDESSDQSTLVLHNGGAFVQPDAIG